ncbi:unnamed protein product, partial [marine sediment metagenome]
KELGKWIWFMQFDKDVRKFCLILILFGKGSGKIPYLERVLLKILLRFLVLIPAVDGCLGIILPV